MISLSFFYRNEPSPTHWKAFVIAAVYNVGHLKVENFPGKWGSIQTTKVNWDRK